MAADKFPISLAFNCGYARVAALEYSFIRRGKSRVSIDRETRIKEFKNLFQDYENFARPAEFWHLSQYETKSTFNRYCDSVLDDFLLNWKSKEHREQYKCTFSTEKW